MYIMVKLFGVEIYIEYVNGRCQLTPLWEYGEGGTVVRFLWFWIAYSKV
jgi:hypothetical protein